jgi:hypothetical protein
MPAPVHVPVLLTLGVATPGGAWHVAHVTLWFAPPPPTDHATLEQEAIAAYSAANLRSDAVHVWLMEEDGWEEDAGIAEDRRRKRAVSEEDLPL